MRGGIISKVTAITPVIMVHLIDKNYPAKLYLAISSPLDLYCYYEEAFVGETNIQCPFSSGRTIFFIHACSPLMYQVVYIMMYSTSSNIQNLIIRTSKLMTFIAFLVCIK